MKTSLLALSAMMLAAVTHAAPLSPSVSLAIGAGVAAANQLHPTTTPLSTAAPLAPRVTLAVPAAPVPVFIAPAAVRTR